MKKARLLTAIIMVSLVFLPACGKKGGGDAEEGTEQTGTVTPSPVTPSPPTPPTPTPTPTPSPVGGDAPLSYEVDKTGGSAIFITTPISTDNVLRVRYEVGPAGNQFFDGTDVRVEISVNGTTRIPRYTSDPACPAGGCEYGRPSDGPSDIMDFSGVVTPGVPVQIEITQARYNWYCYSGTYPGFYDPYNGCNYRLVQDPNPGIGFPGHYWKGRLIVQTHETDVSIFESNNP